MVTCISPGFFFFFLVLSHMHACRVFLSASVSPVAFIPMSAPQVAGSSEQEEGDFYSNTLHHQETAACGPMEAFQDDLLQDSSSPEGDIKTTDTRDSDQAKDSRMKEAPMDRSRAFDDPGICHVRDVFFCYAFIARFFGIIRKACVGMPLEMYKFEVLHTALLSRRRMRMLDSINCAIINLIVADDPRSGNVNFSSYTKYLRKMQLELRSTDFNTLDYENPFQQTENYYDVPPLMRIKLLTTLVEQALERSSYIKEQIETWYADNELSSIREEPFGYDRYGRTYWIFDKRSMLIFRETKYTDAWQCITKSLRDVRRLVSYFTQTNNSMEQALRQKLIDEVIRSEKEHIVKVRKAKAYKTKLTHTQEGENVNNIEARNTDKDLDQELLRDRQVGALEALEDDNLSDVLNSDYDDPNIEEDISRFVAMAGSNPSPNSSTVLSDDPIAAEKIPRHHEYADDDKSIMDAFGNKFRPKYVNDDFDGWVTAVVISTPSAKETTTQNEAKFVPFHGNTLNPTIEATEAQRHSPSSTFYLSTLSTAKGAEENVLREQWHRTCDFLDFK